VPTRLNWIRNRTENWPIIPNLDFFFFLLLKTWLLNLTFFKCLFNHLLLINFSLVQQFVSTLSTALMFNHHPVLNHVSTSLAQLCFRATVLNMLLVLIRCLLSRAISAFLYPLQTLLWCMLHHLFRVQRLKCLAQRTCLLSVLINHMLVFICLKNHFATILAFRVVPCALSLMQSKLTYKD